MLTIETITIDIDGRDVDVLIGLTASQPVSPAKS
jgi:hypothetical protein